MFPLFRETPKSQLMVFQLKVNLMVCNYLLTQQTLDEPQKWYARVYSAQLILVAAFC